MIIRFEVECDTLKDLEKTLSRSVLAVRKYSNSKLPGIIKEQRACEIVNMTYTYIKEKGPIFPIKIRDGLRPVARSRFSLWFKEILPLIKEKAIGNGETLVFIKAPRGTTMLKIIMADHGNSLT